MHSSKGGLMKNKSYLQNLRVTLKLTQEELAKVLKTRQSTVSSWEVGRRQPGAKHAWAIIRLCRKHGIEANLEDLISE